jgi:hypothetical protein
VVYRPRWQRALSRTEKSATLGNESRVVRHNNNASSVASIDERKLARTT